MDPADIDMDEKIPGYVKGKGQVYEDRDGKIYEEIMITVRDQSKLTSLLLKIMNLVVMFYPLLASIYSKVIWDCRSFTQPTERLQEREQNG